MNNDVISNVFLFPFPCFLPTPFFPQSLIHKHHSLIPPYVFLFLHLSFFYVYLGRSPTYGDIFFFPFYIV